MPQTARIPKQQYYLNIAEEVSRRSTCLSTQFGCILVKDDQIIATGYNGAPRKTKDCMELGFCLRRKLGIPSGTQYETCRSVHGEQNALINAARAGVSLLGADLYLYGRRVLDGQEGLVKAYPCFICKKMILNAGINHVFGNNEKGNIVEYKVEDWTREWAERDMVEDTQKYNAGYKTGEGLKEAKSSCCGGCCADHDQK